MLCFFKPSAIFISIYRKKLLFQKFFQFILFWPQNIIFFTPISSARILIFFIILQFNSISCHCCPNLIRNSCYMILKRKGKFSLFCHFHEVLFLYWNWKMSWGFLTSARNIFECSLKTTLLKFHENPSRNKEAIIIFWAWCDTALYIWGNRSPIAA